jgi:hypothetical protein
LKTIKATKQEKERLEKAGLTNQAASLKKRIENQQFMCERTDEVLSVACKFYNEKLMESGEFARREERKSQKTREAAQGIRTEEQEKAGQEARKQARKSN